jgi:hypothetical protein
MEPCFVPFDADLRDGRSTHSWSGGRCQKLMRALVRHGGHVGNSPAQLEPLVGPKKEDFVFLDRTAEAGAKLM